MPGGKNQAEHSRRWNKDNMKSFSVRVRNEEAEQFRMICEREGKTPYSALVEFIHKKVEENQA